MGLTGGFITNLTILISLVMWRLPKKEHGKVVSPKVKLDEEPLGTGYDKAPLHEVAVAEGREGL